MWFPGNSNLLPLWRRNRGQLFRKVQPSSKTWILRGSVPCWTENFYRNSTSKISCRGRTSRYVASFDRMFSLMWPVDKFSRQSMIYVMSMEKWVAPFFSHKCHLFVSLSDSRKERQLESKSVVPLSWICFFVLYWYMTTRRCTLNSGINVSSTMHQ